MDQNKNLKGLTNMTSSLYGAKIWKHYYILDNSEQYDL